MKKVLQGKEAKKAINELFREYDKGNINKEDIIMWDEAKNTIKIIKK